MGILKKVTKTKAKGEFIRTRHIYKLCGVPIFFRDDKVSYAKEFEEKYFLSKRYFINDKSPMSLNVGKYIAECPNIVEKVQNLIQNLSPNDTQKIVRVINRLKRNYLNKGGKFEIFSKKEQEILKEVSHFWDNVVELTPNAFCYDGYFLPIHYFYPNVFYYKHGMHFFDSKTLDSIKRKDFIDVGGFIADSAIIFEREFCDKKIHTFEATKTNFNLMLKTLELNKSKRIVPINKGLGSKNETLEISFSTGASTLNEEVEKLSNFSRTESAEIITLDSYVEQNNVEVGFIKVDIEGFEQEFLKGAFQTIKKFKPAMLISIYHTPSDFFDIKPMIESWNLGYTFKFDKPIDGLISEESVLYCEVL